MAYVTYTTDALVCGTFKRNTSDGSYLLFTREAGMLYADARSVRDEKSKQRYALQDFSLIKVSLVKGKRGWKVGSVQSLQNFYHDAVDKSSRGSVVSIFRTLRRFVKGEEVVTKLFDSAISYLQELAVPMERRGLANEIAGLLILAELGYVDKGKIPKDILSSSLGEVTKQADQELETTVHRLYTQAVSVSHL